MAYILIRTGYITEKLAIRQIHFCRTEAQLKIAKEQLQAKLDVHEIKVEVRQLENIRDIKQLNKEDKANGLTIV